jgi:hypothetical protein
MPGNPVGGHQGVRVTVTSAFNFIHNRLSFGSGGTIRFVSDDIIINSAPSPADFHLRHCAGFDRMRSVDEQFRRLSGPEDWLRFAQTYLGNVGRHRGRGGSA